MNRIQKLSILTEQAYLIRLYIKSGHDLSSSLRSVQSKISSDILVKIIRLSTSHGLAYALENCSTSKVDFVERVFVQLLKVGMTNQSSLTSTMTRFAELNSRITDLLLAQRAQMFIPYFQMGVAALVTFSFVIIFPKLSPMPVPSFFDLGVGVLFYVGVSWMLIGFCLMVWLASVSQRRFLPLLEYSAFFSFLLIFLESGLDIQTSWKRSIESALSEKTKKIFSSYCLPAHSFIDSLVMLSQSIGSPWSLSLQGLSSLVGKANSIHEFIEWILRVETDRSFKEWSFLCKKVSAATMIPILFFVFPATLFLIIGPLLLEISQ